MKYHIQSFMKNKQGNISFLLSMCTQHALVSCSIAFHLQKNEAKHQNCLPSLDGLKVCWIHFQNPVLPRRREQLSKRFQKNAKQKNYLYMCNVIPHCTACNNNMSVCGQQSCVFIMTPLFVYLMKSTVWFDSGELVWL